MFDVLNSSEVDLEDLECDFGATRGMFNYTDAFESSHTLWMLATTQTQQTDRECLFHQRSFESVSLE